MTQLSPPLPLNLCPKFRTCTSNSSEGPSPIPSSLHQLYTCKHFCPQGPAKIPLSLRFPRLCRLKRLGQRCLLTQETLFTLFVIGPFDPPIQWQQPLRREHIRPRNRPFDLPSLCARGRVSRQAQPNTHPIFFRSRSRSRLQAPVSGAWGEFQIAGLWARRRPTRCVDCGVGVCLLSKKGDWWRCIGGSVKLHVMCPLGPAACWRTLPCPLLAL